MRVVERLNGLLALLLAPDVEKERKLANERFARRPPQSLEEELAWQDEVQLRADADRILREARNKESRHGPVDWLLREAFGETVRAFGKERLELLLGKRFRPTRQKLSLEEARTLRSLLSGVDSEGEAVLHYGGDAE